jgi:hypothetical protein
MTMTQKTTKILIFTEGTLLMQAPGKNMTREERVKQSALQSDDMTDFSSYIPIGQAIQKVTSWQRQGANIFYLTSRTTPKEVAKIRDVLLKYHFPDVDNLQSRMAGQTYSDVAEKLMPGILIEDDCENIGGEKEMTYPHIKPNLKSQIHSLVVKEFEGIDHLPDTIGELQ